ncbi:LamG-like jellyroll fold domain-containing protein [Salinimicrobium flavum]|uniref:LamG-like jellyroll fold domain-containing protein n=1 Tax=Salinimicrobium flavum TaxID=1737065 RepID=A0ABW5ISA2_9FLAO
MSKIFTSLKILGIFLLLTSSALASFWNYSTSGSYDFPQNDQKQNSWSDSPYGIFALSFSAYEENATVTAPGDIQTSTDAGNCSATITIPSVTYTGSSLSWSMTGATTKSGTGQIGSQTFSKGITTITFTANGDNDTSAQDSMIVTVTDEVFPTITLGNDFSKNTDPGQCIASVAVPAASFEDNCTGSTLAWNMSGTTTASGTGQVGTKALNIGVTTITYTVTDAANNTSEDSVIITVLDNEVPTVSAAADFSKNTDPGQCTASIAVPAASFEDNCTGSTLAWNMSGTTTASGTGQVGTKALNIGVTTITYTVTDAANNTSEDSVIITVLDNEVPTVSAAADFSKNTDSGQCTVSVAVPAASFDDNCTGSTLAWNMSGATIASGTGQVGTKALNIGVTTVTYTVTDAANNTSEDSVKITVLDNEVPTVSAAADFSKNTDPGQCIASVAVPTASFGDNCTGSTLAWNMSGATTASGTGQVGTKALNIGVTTVTYTVTDATNNTSEDSVIITVLDNEVPTVSAAADFSKNTDPGQCIASVAVPTASFDDNCTGSTLAWSMSGATSGSGTGQVGTRALNIGETTITYTVTDAANNTSEDSVKITVLDNEIPVITAGANLTVPNDAGECSAEVPVTPSTATDNCSVGQPSGTRNDGLALTAAFPVGTTTITWTVTDANNNKATDVQQTITVEDKEAPIVPVLEDITWGCAYTVLVPTAPDNCSGTITATANRSTTFTSSGTIIWTFTDAAGNSSTAPQNITISPVQVTSTKVDILCHGAATGEIRLNASGGVAPYTYTWNGGLGSGATQTGLTAGTYTVTVKDSNGCEAAPMDITLTEPSQLSMTSLQINNVTCNDAGDGSVIGGEVTGGVGGYQYQVTGRPFQSSKEFTNLAPGSYTFTVKDQNSCLLEEDFVITEPAGLSMATPTTTEVTCHGGNDGTITAGNVTGGTPPFEYSIDNVNFYSTSLFEGVSAGNHTIFVKDANNCALQVPITVTQPNVLTGNLTKTNVSCFEGSDGTITISSASGGHETYEYSIDGTTWQSAATFSGLTAGTYSVSVRDAAYPACTVNLDPAYVLTEPTAPVSAEVTTTRTLAYGTSTGSATVEASGGTPGYTYEWRRKGEENVLQYTKTATSLPAGFYEVTVIDSKGCPLIIKEVEIIDAIQAFILTRSTCEIEGDIDAIRTFHYIVQDETALGGVAPYTYSWDFGDGAIDQDRIGIGEFSVDYTTIGNKTITLTVSDSTGVSYTTTQEQYVGKCYNPCGRSSNIDFDPNDIYIGYSDGTRMDKTSEDYCDPTIEKFIFLGVTKSANIYNPYIELTYIISNSIEVVTNTYYADGCREKENIDEDLTVNQDNRVGKFIKLTTTPIEFDCGDNLNIDTFYITWTNVSRKECGANNNKFCWSTNEPLQVPTELRIEASPTHILCKGDETGTITVKASGGFAPYGYRLSETGTSQDSNQFYNLKAGTYTVYVEDSAGETKTTTVIITEPETSLSAETSFTSPLCFGYTGTATVSVISPEGIGTPFEPGALENDEKYKYLWNDPSEQTTPTATNLPAGEYTVTVIDANGCQTLETVVITQPEQLTVAETGPDQNFGCGFFNTFLEANTPVTGVGTWTVIDAPNTNWELPEPNNPDSAFNAPAGTYTLRWTIAHADGSCGTSSDMLITFKGDCSTLDFDGIDDYVFIGNRNNFPSSDFSIEVWVKPESVHGLRTVISKRNTANITAGGYDLVINNGAPTFRWNGKSVSTSYKVGTDRWYHLAVIFKGSEVELYVDGIKVGNSTGSKPVSNASPFLIGAMFNANEPEVPQNYFEGWIEELRVWNTALTVEQIRFMMNQRIVPNGTAVKGEILPMNVPGELNWSSLVSYYRLIAEDAQVANGIAVDRANNGLDGHLRNIETLQKNTAPLPYISEANGGWKTRGSWDIHIGSDGENFWTWPNDKGINGTNIDWNIAYVTHELNSGSKNITLLGFLLNGGKLDMLGNNPVRTASGLQSGSGNGLTITKYLDLGGFIDLNGESQLIQTEGSILVGNGNIQRDQQGTASSYNYNYWTSPVSISGNSQNTGYKIFSVMKDGTAPVTPRDINFDISFRHADGPPATPIKISGFWLHKFFGDANEYSQWERIDAKSSLLKSGEGFSMKGSSGSKAILDLQNYTFTGMPNNGTIPLNITPGKNYLIGNPYPSAIDANEFIRDNLGERRDGTNVFNGSLYFWSHFSGYTHYLNYYIGGYAVYNLSGGIKAIANDERVNATLEEGGEKPQQFIPVGQAFFVNTVLDNSITTQSNISIHGGEIRFKNSQRFFVTEIDKTKSVYHSQERKDKKTSSNSTKETRQRIWIKFKSPEGYHRQLLVTADKNATSGFDLGYDAPLIENNKEDMYWMMGKIELVIQGVPDFNKDRILPLGIKTAEGGEFTISIDELENIDDEFRIFIKDKETETYHDLREADFIGTAVKGNLHDRYSLVFSQNEESGEEETEEETGEENTEEDGKDGSEETEATTPQPVTLGYSNTEGKIIIRNPGQRKILKAVLYNGLAQELQTYSSIPLDLEVKLPVELRNAGVYLVRLTLENETVSLKFIIE